MERCILYSALYGVQIIIQILLIHIIHCDGLEKMKKMCLLFLCVIINVITLFYINICSNCIYHCSSSTHNGVYQPYMRYCRLITMRINCLQYTPRTRRKKYYISLAVVLTHNNSFLSYFFLFCLSQFYLIC